MDDEARCTPPEENMTSPGEGVSSEDDVDSPGSDGYGSSTGPLKTRKQKPDKGDRLRRRKTR